MERDFKGIWIPREVWLSKELTLQEKVFYVEIDSLDNEAGCYANNHYFAEFFGVSQVRVSEVINNLVRKGFVSSDVDQANGNRRILHTLLKKSLRGVTKESLRPSQRKVCDPLKEKFIHNNKVNNTKNKDIYIGEPDPETKPEEEEWNYPLKQLVEAFPDYLPDRITPSFIGFLEAEVKPGDEVAWANTIERYQMNFDPMLNRYLPDKVANLLGVFKTEKRNLSAGAVAGSKGNARPGQTIWTQQPGNELEFQRMLERQEPLHND